MVRRGDEPFVQDRKSEHANEQIVPPKCNEYLNWLFTFSSGGLTPSNCSVILV
jgi:hypothetical protein